MSRERRRETIPTDSVDLSELLRSGGVEITQSTETWKELSSEHGVPINEIKYIDFNRSGVRLPGNEVRIGYRARFVTTVNSEVSTWFALPVRGENDTNFAAGNGYLRFQTSALAAGILRL